MSGRVSGRCLGGCFRRQLSLLESVAHGNLLFFRICAAASFRFCAAASFLGYVPLHLLDNVPLHLLDNVPLHLFR